MKSYDEVRAMLTPPHKCDNQQEFDGLMNQMRIVQNELTADMKERTAELIERRREIGREMAALNLELSAISHEREEIRKEMKGIGGIFHSLKKELIRLNPVIMPSTAREEADNV